MSLDLYRRKRDFKATPEPEGKAARRGGDSFVIHKHAARRLHYDLRLEMDGVQAMERVLREGDTAFPKREIGGKLPGDDLYAK